MPFTDEVICNKLDRIIELLDLVHESLYTDIRSNKSTVAFDSVNRELLLTTKQAAQFLGLTNRFLESKRITGGGPPFVKISSRAVRYRESELRKWVEERTILNTAQEIPVELI